MIGYIIAILTFVVGGIYLIMHEHLYLGGFLLVCATFVSYSKKDNDYDIG